MNNTPEVANVRLEMINPDSRQAETDYRALVGHYFGPEASEFADRLKRESSIKLLGELGPKIDEHFYNIFVDKFCPNSSVVTPVTAYTQAYSVAAEVVGSLARYIQNPAGDALRDELSRPSTSPAHLLLAIEGGKRGEHLDLSSQARRMFMLTLTAAELGVRSGNGRLNTLLTELDFLWDEVLFEKGDPKTEKLYAYQRRETNHIRRVSDKVDVAPGSDEDIRLYGLSCRSVTGVGHVRTQARGKDLAVATKKAWVLAAIKDGVVKPELVSDHMGTMFTTSGRQREKLIKRVEEILKSHYSLTDDDIERVGGPESGRGQAKTTAKELLVNMPGVDVPLQLLIQTYRGFLNDAHEIGVMHEDGFYRGRAHDLYLLRRDNPAAGYIIPEDSYQVDIHEALRAAQNPIVERLRNEGDRLRLYVFNPQKPEALFSNGSIADLASSQKGI